MANRRPWLFPLIAVVIVLVAGIGSLAYLYYRATPAPGTGVITVQEGSNVTVNYIGTFGSGPEIGRIFDTSIYSIGSNPAYPKALDFHARSVANSTPLPVHIGASTPSGGYTVGNTSFIQVVSGFWEGILGMEINSTRVVSVPPDLGYGPIDSACESVQPLVESIPVIQTITGASFSASYPGITAANGVEFTDPHFGWTDQIMAANTSYVTLQSLPYVGETSSPAGWPVQVTSISQVANGTGEITVRNLLTPDEAGHLQGNDYLGTGPCSSANNNQFIVSNVDLGNGTYTENYNQEVQGQTLIFTITVVQYFAPGVTTE
jgi:hypothetical protein